MYMAASNKQEQFEEALAGKKLPVLTLDAKWYRLLDVVPLRFFASDPPSA